MSVGYEKKDASARVVVIAAGLLILLSVFAGVAARLVLHFLSRSYNPAP
jgi:hypothetical protein